MADVHILFFYSLAATVVDVPCMVGFIFAFSCFLYVRFIFLPSTTTTTTTTIMKFSVGTLCSSKSRTEQVHGIEEVKGGEQAKNFRPAK